MMQCNLYNVHGIQIGTYAAGNIKKVFNILQCKLYTYTCIK